MSHNNKEDFAIRYAELRSIRFGIEGAFDNWKEQLKEVEKAIEDIENMDSFKGETATALKNYFNTVHKTILTYIKDIFEDYLGKYRTYVNDYNAYIDTAYEARFQNDVIEAGIGFLREDVSLVGFMLEEMEFKKEASKYADLYEIPELPTELIIDGYNEVISKLNEFLDTVKEFEDKKLEDTEDITKQLDAIEKIIDDELARTDVMSFSRNISVDANYKTLNLMTQQMENYKKLNGEAIENVVEFEKEQVEEREKYWKNYYKNTLNYVIADGEETEDGKIIKFYLGFVPGLGLAIDAKDMYYDIENLSDGATNAELLNTGIDSLAVGLGINELRGMSGAVKYSDDILENGDELLKHSDDVWDTVKNTNEIFIESKEAIQAAKIDKKALGLTDISAVKYADGDPVDMVTGSFSVKEADLDINTLNGAYQIVRNYESALDTIGGLSKNKWVFNIESSLTFAKKEENDYIIVLLESAKTIVFKKEDDTNYVQENGSLEYALTKESENYILKNIKTKEIYHYNENGNILDKQDKNANTIKYIYSDEMLEKVDFGENIIINITYNDKQQIASVTDTIGRTTKYVYNDKGYLIQVIYPDGAVISYNYDDNENIAEITDARGITYVKGIYDTHGRVLHQDMINGEEYTYEYNTAQKETIIKTKSRNDQKIYNYDEDGNIVKITYADKSFEEMKYDLQKNLTYKKDRRGLEIYNSYNQNKQLVQQKTSDGLIVNIDYDEENRKYKQYDNAGREEYYKYDNQGNCIEIKSKIDDKRYKTVSYVYDDKGRILEEKDSKGEVRQSYTYTEGQLKPSVITRSEGQTVKYTYDKIGRKLSEEDDDGKTIYEYNEWSKLAKIVTPSGTTHTYTYDKSRNLVKEEHPEQHVITYTYDEMDKLEKTITGANTIFAKKRNPAGDIIKEIHPEYYNEDTDDGEGIAYDYDSEGRMIRKHLSTGGIQRIFYNFAGDIVKVVEPDNYNRFSDNGAGYTYTYDEKGKLIQVENPEKVIEKRYVYDLAGRLVKSMTSKDIELDDGTCTLYKYDKVGNLIEKREPADFEEDNTLYQLTEYNYDEDGKLLQEVHYLEPQNKTSKTGRVRIIYSNYDKSGRVVEIKDTTGACVRYSYDKKDRKIKEQKRINETAWSEKQYIYDKEGNISKEIEKINNKYTEILYEYDKNNRLTKLKTPTGYEIRKTYDIDGRCIKEEHIDKINSINNKILYKYDKANNLIEITDARGATTAYAYDTANNLIQETDTIGAIKKYKYNYADMLTNIIMPNENAKLGDYAKGTSYIYDAMQRLVKVVDSYGKTKKELEYNAYGELVKETDALNREKHYKYSYAGKKIYEGTKQTHVTYKYDILGNVVEMSENDVRTTHFKLDEWGRVVKTISPTGIEEYYTYDYAGNVSETINGNGGKIRYNYNDINKVEEIIYQNGRKENYIYDEEKRLIQYKKRSGESIYYAYNMYGSLTQKTSDDRLTYSKYSYDETGLLKNAYTKDMAYDYEYDKTGRLKGKKAGGRLLIGYEYDLNGNIKKQTDITGKNVTYEYDYLDRIKKVYDNGEEQAIYSYYANGQIESVKIGKDILTKYSYDENSNITNLKTIMGNKIITDNAYKYDIYGNCIEKKVQGISCDPEQRAVSNYYGISTIEEQNNYEYDLENRLIKAEYPKYIEEFAYDPCGNRINRTATKKEETNQAYIPKVFKKEEPNQVYIIPTALNKTLSNVQSITENYSYNEANQLTGAQVTVKEPQKEPDLYDRRYYYEQSYRNDMMQDKTKEYNITYEYDKDGNMTKDNKGTYYYNAFDQMVKAKVQDETGREHTQINRYDAEELRVEMIENDKLVQYIYNKDKAVAEVREEELTRIIRGVNNIISSDSVEARNYYHYACDERGSITNTINETKNDVCERITYDAFGNIIEKIGDDLDRINFGYAGERYDYITNQIYLRARFYSPAIGRFVSEDTYHGDGLNLYSYVANNPNKYVDPNGHEKSTPLLKWLKESLEADGYDTTHLVNFSADVSENVVKNVETDFIVAPGGVVFDTNDYKNMLVNENDGITKLYHYTNDKGLEGILESGNLKPSIKALNPKDARYGNGQYLSDVVPGEKTLGQLSHKFLKVPWGGRKFTNYIEIDVTGLDIIKGRDGVYLIPNEDVLNIENRIISYGKSVKK